MHWQPARAPERRLAVRSDWSWCPAWRPSAEARPARASRFAGVAEKFLRRRSGVAPGEPGG